MPGMRWRRVRFRLRGGVINSRLSSRSPPAQLVGNGIDMPVVPVVLPGWSSRKHASWNAENFCRRRAWSTHRISFIRRYPRTAQNREILVFNLLVCLGVLVASTCSALRSPQHRGRGASFRVTLHGLIDYLACNDLSFRRSASHAAFRNSITSSRTFRTRVEDYCLPSCGLSDCPTGRAWLVAMGGFP